MKWIEIVVVVLLCCGSVERKVMEGQTRGFIYVADSVVKRAPVPCANRGPLDGFTSTAPSLTNAFTAYRLLGLPPFTAVRSPSPSFSGMASHHTKLFTTVLYGSFDPSCTHSACVAERLGG